MIVAVMNNKGGTGKTTTCTNLGAAFAELGYNVLVVDLDPQGSASISLGATNKTLQPSLSNVLFDGTAIRSAVRNSPTPGLHFLTADVGMYHTDLVFANVAGREDRLRTVMETIEDDYDFILLDCPPYFSLVNVNALVAADAYIIPVTPDYLALEDISCMTGLVDELRQSMNVDADLLGIVVTMTPTGRSVFNPRVRAARGNIRALRKQFDEDVFTTEIAVDLKLAEAPQYGSTVFGTAPASHPAKQFRQLAEELIQRCGILKLKAESRRIARQRRQQRSAVKHKGSMAQGQRDARAKSQPLWPEIDVPPQAQQRR